MSGRSHQFSRLRLHCVIHLDEWRRKLAECGWLRVEPQEFLRRVNTGFAAGGDFTRCVVEVHGLIRKARKRFNIPRISGANTHGHIRDIHHAAREENGNTISS